MSETLTCERPLVIAVSSRALFDLEHSNRIFEVEGREAYVRHQQEHEDEPLRPGPAFPLVRALLNLNRFGKGCRLVEAIVISGNDPSCGIRLIRSAAHHELDIVRAAFTSGSSITPYLSAFGVDLLLSRSQNDVQMAIDSGIAAAHMYAAQGDFGLDEETIRIAFDGDAVLFDDASEAIYKTKGLEAFQQNEISNADVPMAEGPMFHFLRVLRQIQKAVPEGERRALRIALVTSRGSPAHERALKTLRAWGVGVDEAFFLGGMKKEPVLKAFKPHIFFDDQDVHLAAVSAFIPSGRVPYASSSAMVALGLAKPAT
jgi:5'-nucleotidase